MRRGAVERWRWGEKSLHGERGLCLDAAPSQRIRRARMWGGVAVTAMAGGVHAAQSV
jgi:hypothetical protein